MNIEKAKINGQRGSWFVGVSLSSGSETLPCIQDYYWASKDLWIHPIDDRMKKDRKRFDAVVAAVKRTGKVVVTQNKIIEENGVLVNFKRVDYSGVFAADVIRDDNDGIVIKLNSRLANIKK
jgi:hypothetical protein